MLLPCNFILRRFGCHDLGAKHLPIYVCVAATEKKEFSVNVLKRRKETVEMKQTNKQTTRFG